MLTWAAPNNAVAESFFHSLKTEHVYLNKFKSREAAKQRVFEFIEVFYNRDRLHFTGAPSDLAFAVQSNMKMSC